MDMGPSSPAVQYIPWLFVDPPSHTASLSQKEYLILYHKGHYTRIATEVSDDALTKVFTAASLIQEEAQEVQGPSSNSLPDID